MKTDHPLNPLPPELQPQPARRQRRFSSRRLWLAVIGMIGMGAAATAWGLVQNSRHDFSVTSTGSPWGGGASTEDQICIFCHTPHGAQVGGGAPLWNRNYTAPTFTLYSSATLNAAVAQPVSNSLACLSCHDGAVAIDSYVVGGPATPVMLAIGDVYFPGPFSEGGGPNIGDNFGGFGINDLSNDHPVSFAYDDALVLADAGGLKTVAAVTASALPLYSGNVECATCHDVHNTSGGIPALLRVSNANAALCLTCHNK